MNIACVVVAIAIISQGDASDGDKARRLQGQAMDRCRVLGTAADLFIEKMKFHQQHAGIHLLSVKSFQICEMDTPQQLQEVDYIYFLWLGDHLEKTGGDVIQQAVQDAGKTKDIEDFFEYLTSNGNHAHGAPQKFLDGLREYQKPHATNGHNAPADIQESSRHADVEKMRNGIDLLKSLNILDATAKVFQFYSWSHTLAINDSHEPHEVADMHRSAHDMFEKLNQSNRDQH